MCHVFQLFCFLQILLILIEMTGNEEDYSRGDSEMDEDEEMSGRAVVSRS